VLVVLFFIECSPQIELRKREIATPLFYSRSSRSSASSRTKPLLAEVLNESVNLESEKDIAEARLNLTLQNAST